MEMVCHLPYSPRKQMWLTSIRLCRRLMRLLSVPSTTDRNGSGRTRAMTASRSGAPYANEGSNLRSTTETSPTVICPRISGTIDPSDGMHPVVGRLSAPSQSSISNDDSIISGNAPVRSTKVSCPLHSFVVT